MLIKIMRDGIPAAEQINVGDTVLRYVLSDAYDRGEVIEVFDNTVVVDFADNIRSFDCSFLSLVLWLEDECWITCQEGILVKSFSQTPDATVENIEDLFDFDRWMV